MAAPKKPWITYILTVILVGLTSLKALGSLYRIITTSAPDFWWYYHAEVSLLPPISRLVYLPLRLFSYDVAQGGWVVASFLCFLWIIRKLGASAWMGALAFLSFPTRFTLGMGQVNFIALTVLVSAVTRESGILFALAILLKPELILLFIPLVLKKYWRLVGQSFYVFVPALFISLALFGASAYIAYQAQLLPLFAQWNDIGIYYNQGISGLVARAGGSAWMYVGIAIVVIGSSARSLWKKKLTLSALLWRSMPAFILVEPIAWQHHLVFLIPTYFMIWVQKNYGWSRMFLVISYLLVSWNFVHPEILDTMPLGWALASHGTMGVFILWMLSL